MKKYIYLLIVLMAILCVGCTKSNNRLDKGRNMKKVGNMVTAGETIKDDSVFGENVFVFSPQDKKKNIQDKIDEIYKSQESNQFGDERYAILFKPGIYSKKLEVNVGFYTQVSGLGEKPTDTNVNKLWVNANWMDHNATCNFWRSVENFSINEFCMWANSQAVSMRRISSEADMLLCDRRGWSSGGFIAESKFKGTVASGTQQQYMSRNTEWKSWEGGVWNMVFVGIDKSLMPQGEWPERPFTKVENTPKIQEKPYLMYDEKNGYGVMVPELRTNCTGVSWKDEQKGIFYSLNTFYIAKPDKDNADSINKALEEGKNVLFTPGIYEIDKALEVKYEDTIIYGMGLATLVATNGNACIKTADEDGIKLCGLLLEAGEKESDTLLQVGDKKAKTDHEKNPIALSDLFFRVGGGKYAGKVKNCVTINSNDVIGDDFWVWRADHSQNVGWDINKATNGIIINGDNVTMYGLFVEHFEEYQTIWNGENGQLYFYQSEMPYDVPGQDEYKSHNGTVNGYASVKVADKVKKFNGYGIGVYCCNYRADIEQFSAVEVPKRKGVALHNVVTVNLHDKGQITHGVNDQGEATSNVGTPYRIMEYENGLIK